MPIHTPDTSCIRNFATSGAARWRPWSGLRQLRRLASCILGAMGRIFHPEIWDFMGFHGTSMENTRNIYIYDIMYIYIKYHTWNIIGTYMEHVWTYEISWRIPNPNSLFKWFFNGTYRKLIYKWELPIANRCGSNGHIKVGKKCGYRTIHAIGIQWGIYLLL